ncbi:MAG: glycosyltransferase family 2 protein [Treponema sp.]|jgi:glycosyltransferase involved in cell wall biosynthesis|nr:glycosyltransferase family 2 protein [Treponema sp.]
MDQKNAAAGIRLLSVIVPCFNEESSLPLFYDETVKILDGLRDREKGENIEGEFIFVDDGSFDGTAAVLRALAGMDSRVHYILFSRNFGKEAAMLAGLQECRGQAAVILDADLQHPPSLIPAMLEAVESGEFDCAGTLRLRTGEPPVRSLFSRFFYRLMEKLADVKMPDGAGDFRLMSRKYIEAVLSLHERNRFLKGIFPWVGFRIKWFEFKNIERIAGETKWPFWKLLIYSLDGVTAFSSRLLSLASAAGICMFLVALGFIVFIIVYRIGWGSTVDGWASTACIVLLCSGVQLFSAGILGLYLAKIYTEVKQRPHYLVHERR